MIFVAVSAGKKKNTGFETVPATMDLYLHLVEANNKPCVLMRYRNFHSKYSIVGEGAKFEILGLEPLNHHLLCVHE